MLPRAVIFDMDGLLIDTGKVSEATFRQTCHAHDAGLAADQYAQLIGRKQEEQRAIFADMLPDHVDILRFDKNWRDLFLDQLRHSVPLKPYARSLCQWLDKAGVPMAVATSTQTTKAEMLLERAGLGGYMKQVIGGDQVSYGKPAPDLYISAAAALSCAPPSAIAFEDSHQGIRAAFAAGIPVVHIPDLLPADAFTRKHAIRVSRNLHDAAISLGWPLETQDLEPN